MEGCFDAAALGHRAIGAFADHLAEQFLRGDADAVIGSVAGRLFALVRGANIIADAAEEDQIGARIEDGADEIVRRDMLGDSEQGLRFRRQLDVFGGARIYAAAFGQQRSIEILPARTRQIEQPLAFGEGAQRVRIGIDEYVAMIEGGNELDGFLAQHAIAEDVAGHVADADY